jgi:hypothetical protein
MGDYQNEESRKVLDEMSAFLHLRASSEDSYARGLRKLASVSFPIIESLDDTSTLGTALSAIQGDLLNKAVQHETLAGHLIGTFYCLSMLS